MATLATGTGILDLLGDTPPVERKNRTPEAGALKEIFQALAAHPAVAWCERMNSGATKIVNRFVRFGWTGLPGCNRTTARWSFYRRGSESRQGEVKAGTGGIS